MSPASAWARKFVRDDEGATAMVVAVMILVLLGVGALTVDAGALYAERRQMQTGADAAALAGVQELPGDPGAAVSQATSYADTNASFASGQTFTVSSTYAANDTITALLNDPARQLFLAKFIGHDTASVSAKATAIVASPSAYSHGVMPFGIMSKEPSGTTSFGYAFNELVRLKQPSQQGEAGNFQFLALTDPPGGHTGNADIRYALSNGGVPNAVYLWELYNTRTGINGNTVSNGLNEWIAGHEACTFDGVTDLNPDGTVNIVDPDCHRVIVCPIIVDPGPPVAYNWIELNGQSRPIQVIGFSYFYIESIGTTGNDCYVDGRFIRPVGPDEDVLEWGPIDPTGLIAYRLID